MARPICNQGPRRRDFCFHYHLYHLHSIRTKTLSKSSLFPPIPYTSHSLTSLLILGRLANFFSSLILPLSLPPPHHPSSLGSNAADRSGASPCRYSNFISHLTTPSCRCHASASTSLSAQLRFHLPPLYRPATSSAILPIGNHHHHGRFLHAVP